MQIETRKASVRGARPPVNVIAMALDDRPEFTPREQNQQAQKLRSRFGFSWPTARLYAALAYGEAGRVA